MALLVMPRLARADSISADGPEPPARSPRTPCVTTSDYCHDGLYFRVSVLGLGYRAFVSSAGPGSTQSATLSALVAIGGTPVKGVVVGGLLGSDVAGAGDSVQAGAFVDWYPAPVGGWHTGIALEGVLLQTPYGTGWGPAATVMAGYDAWVRSWYSVGLLAYGTAASPENLHDASGAQNGLRVASIEGTLAISLVIH